MICAPYRYAARRAAAGPKAEPAADAGPAAPRSDAALMRRRLDSVIQADLFVPKPTRNVLCHRLTSADLPVPSAGVPWRPPLAMVVVVTHLITHAG
jgi:hypothetical protein